MVNNAYKEIVLFDDAYFYALIDDISAAKYSIDMETYIFKDDTAGKKLAEALCAAAKRGVNIRLLVDGLGSPAWGNELTQKLTNEGISTRIFHPLPFTFRQWQYSFTVPGTIISKMMYWLSRINTRNHRKVCIIDDRIIYIGSANITHYLLTNIEHNEIWRETTVKLVGAKPDELKYVFELAWNHIPIKKRIRDAFKKINPDPVFRLNYSWRRKHVLYQSLLSRMTACKKRIWVTNAYFVPDNHLLKALITASKNGVDVAILLPNKSDVLVSSLASKTFYSQLFKNGVSIFEYMPRTLHAKVLILDDWFMVGSSNLNYRSTKHDLEVDVCIQTDEAKSLLEKQFLHDLSQSKKIGLDDIQKLPFYQYLLGRLILFIRYWL